MDRLTDEAIYVMGVLYQMRNKVIANPTLFVADALDTIDKEIARYEYLVHTNDAA
jgi:hypothetical protein